jgi:3-oxoadipate enol-lactonase
VSLDVVTRSGRGAPLVLMHCLGVDKTMWPLAVPGLADQFELIAFDFPGHGKADLSDGPISIESLSDDLVRRLDALGLQKVHLGGISLGGIVAQDFAARHPARVDKLVLIDTTPRYTDEMQHLWAERAATARNRGVAVMTDGLLDVWFSPAAVAANGPAVRYVRDCFARVSGEGYARACEALADADTRALLPQIEAETLVVCGRDDLPSFRDAAEAMQSAIAKAELLWIDDTRHASILEQPILFATALRSFLTAGASR